MVLSNKKNLNKLIQSALLIVSLAILILLKPSSLQAQVTDLSVISLPSIGPHNHNVSTADFDGDDKPELLIGTPYYTSSNYRGILYVVFDAGNEIDLNSINAYNLDQIYDIKITSELINYSASGAHLVGDVDGDGLDELTISDYDAPIYNGKLLKTLEGTRTAFTTDDTTYSWVHITEPGATFDATMAYQTSYQAPDFDGNGKADFIYWDYARGVMIILDELLTQFASTSTGNQLNPVNDLANDSSYTFTGNIGDDYQAGDFDGDGKDDILITTLYSNLCGNSSSGGWFLITGSKMATFTKGTTQAISDAGAESGWNFDIIFCAEPNDGWGPGTFNNTQALDVDGDGNDDIFLNNPRRAEITGTSTGYLFSGSELSNVLALAPERVDTATYSAYTLKTEYNDTLGNFVFGQIDGLGSSDLAIKHSNQFTVLTDSFLADQTAGSTVDLTDTNSHPGLVTFKKSGTDINIIDVMDIDNNGLDEVVFGPNIYYGGNANAYQFVLNEFESAITVDTVTNQKESTTLQVTGSVTSNHLVYSIADLQFSLNNSSWTDCTLTNNAFTCSVPVSDSLESGDKVNVYFRTTNQYGWTTAAASQPQLNITYDTESPELTFEVVLNNGNTEQRSFDMAGAKNYALYDNGFPELCFSKSQDDASDVTNYTVKLDKELELSIDHRHTQGSLGNKQNGDTNGIYFDGATGSLVRVSNLDQPSSAQQVCVLVPEKHKGNGLHSWEVAAHDEAGNTARLKNGFFFVNDTGSQWVANANRHHNLAISSINAQPANITSTEQQTELVTVNLVSGGKLQLSGIAPHLASTKLLILDENHSQVAEEDVAVSSESFFSHQASYDFEDDKTYYLVLRSINQVTDDKVALLLQLKT